MIESNRKLVLSAKLEVLFEIEADLERASASEGTPSEFALGLANAAGFIGGSRKALKAEHRAWDRGFESGEKVERAAAKAREQIACAEAFEEGVKSVAEAADVKEFDANEDQEDGKTE